MKSKKQKGKKKIASYQTKMKVNLTDLRETERSKHWQKNNKE
jgi:hypothetical protein